MRSIMQDIQSEFRRFIDSRTEDLLIVSCEPDHSALLFKALESLDDAPESLDVFLTFGHPFNDPGQYVREIPPVIGRQLAGVNQELGKRGAPALPPRSTHLPNTTHFRVGQVRRDPGPQVDR